MFKRWFFAILIGMMLALSVESCKLNPITDSPVHDYLTKEQVAAMQHLDQQVEYEAIASSTYDTLIRPLYDCHFEGKILVHEFGDSGDWVCKELVTQAGYKYAGYVFTKHPTKVPGQYYYSTTAMPSLHLGPPNPNAVRKYKKTLISLDRSGGQRFFCLLEQPISTTTEVGLRE